MSGFNDYIVPHYANHPRSRPGLRAGQLLVLGITGSIVVAATALLAAARWPKKTPARFATNSQDLRLIIEKQICSFRIDVGRIPIDLEELFTPPADANEARRWLGPYLESRDGLITASGAPYQYHTYRSTEDGTLRYRLSLGAAPSESTR